MTSKTVHYVKTFQLFSTLADLLKANEKYLVFPCQTAFERSMGILIDAPILIKKLGIENLIKMMKMNQLNYSVFEMEGLALI